MLSDTQNYAVQIRHIGARCYVCAPEYADIPAGTQVMVVKGKDLCVGCYQQMLAGPE